MPAQDRHARRNADWWNLYINGWSQREIAEEYDTTQPHVSQVLTQIRKDIPETDIKMIVDREVAFLDGVKKRAMMWADTLPAVVTAGKDGRVVLDPKTKEPVRDFSGQLRALQTALEAHQKFVRLVGAEAAQQIQIQMTPAEQDAATTAAAEAAARVMEEGE